MLADRRRFLGLVAGSAATIILPQIAKGAPVEPGNGVLPDGMQGFAAPDGNPSWPWQSAPTPAPAPAIDSPSTDPAAARQAAAERFAALLDRARAALTVHGGKLAQQDVVGIVDFAAPSRDPRFYLVDPQSGTVLANHLVAHGRGSDPANRGWVEHLSNRYGSEASCGGSFMTGETYYGKHGRSRRLAGLDPDNDLAVQRGIVIHAASYVDPGLAAIQGRIGRSQGCFAVSREVIGDVLERLGPGRLLFAAR